MTDASEWERLAQKHARAWMEAYGIRTEPYTRSGGDHPMMDTLPAAMLAFAAALRSAGPDDAGRAEGWQPIETAPKDGTVIDGCCMEAQTPRATITWWSGDRWLTVGKPEKFVDPLPHRWWPTHWRLRPPPPAIAAVSDGGERDADR